MRGEHGEMRRAPTRSAASRSPTAGCGSSSRILSCAAAASRRSASASSTSAARPCATSTSSTSKPHAPDRRPPRPDRLPAPAPRAGRRRHAGRTPRAARRRRLLPPVRRLLARRRGTDARDRPARRRRRRPAGRCRRPRATAVSDGGYDVRLDAGAAGPARRPTCASRSPATASPCAPSPTSAPAATWSRCARATSRSCTCTRCPSDGTSIGFAATFPTEGRYRLFLQFQHDGRVQTVAFTQEVAHGAASQLELPITGMTCASCANRIERKLNKLDGVDRDRQLRDREGDRRLRRRRASSRSSSSRPSRPPATTPLPAGRRRRQTARASTRPRRCGSACSSRSR